MTGKQHVRHGRWLGLLGLVLAVGAAADPAKEDGEQLLDESEYPTEIEEIVVTARKPFWRRKPEPEWRQEEVETPPPGDIPRMQWFPRYTREDRDRYDGVRDRMARQPEIKVFEFRF